MSSLLDDCEDCIHFSDNGKDGRCHIYGIPNHNISVCSDYRIWKKNEEIVNGRP